MQTDMQHYRIMSALLTYPEPELLAALPELQAALADRPQIQARLAPLFGKKKQGSTFFVSMPKSRKKKETERV